MKHLTPRGNGNKLQRLDDFFGFDPFEQIASARRTMNSLLDSALNPGSTTLASWVTPSIDLYEKDGKYIVEAALPGLKKDDIDIEVADNRLTLTGKRQEEKAEDNARYHYREVRRGGFARSISFPQDIDAEHIEAEYQNGVLRLTVPTVEPVKAKKVQIKG